ncbi:aminopeptidase P N-terminal domain-containing protein [Cellulomonas iranensis]|uniref:aminopeptidase P N-terminal domain-containing protein n=1 Tax=Cellulomonas iranensis TaxID=76862 RepID=UPI001CF25DCD|nr:aminopeptidase P N-terminal domain-containing protein [Cellulomonas iranensis]UCN15792.1 aminopeptidase P N-terminal domain-containing protein [Cellulomonas iranensis]
MSTESADDLTSETPTPAQDEQPLESRGSNRSHRPQSRRFVEFVTSGWGERPPSTAARAEVADFTAARRSALSARFPGRRLVVPAGRFKVRSNDTDFRFRPHAAFAHLTGLGTEQEPDAVLVLHPVADGTGDDGSAHHAVLYMNPLAGRDTPEFFSDARYGEFWVGARPTLDEVATVTGVETAHLDDLRDALAKDVGAGGVQLLVVPEADEAVDEVVAQIRGEETTGESDALLAEAVSELRLLKDAYEVAQLQLAVDATVAGFEKVVRSLPRAVAHRRGERVIEGTFLGHAREEGNDVGYTTIAAAGEHATTLHWTDNDGRVRAGELVLVDAGVEVDSLYTADVTRTLPVDGTFTDVQRRVYQAVLDAADAGFAAAVPGARFRDVHDAAMRVLAARLEEWGLLPVSAEESLDPDNQHHRRWMVHGTSHHLGLDVHDCAQARAELYLDGVLEPGMVFTIEPGLYFKSDDLLVPAEYRGIGVRIEDDVLLTADGNVNLSAALPRDPDAVEAWMAALREG